MKEEKSIEEIVDDYAVRYVQKRLKDAFRYNMTNTLTHERTLREEKVVLYVDPVGEHNELSHQDRLKLNAREFDIYLGNTTDGVWGDDWNDAPDEHNSGVPYKETVKGLQVIRVRLGKPLTLTDNH